MADHAYQRIADDLRKRIRAEEFKGRPLPAMPELGRQYGVHWLTARKAVERLGGEGLVISDGRRWRVREHKPLDIYMMRKVPELTWGEQRVTAGADAWHAAMAAAGRVPSERVRSAGIEVTTPGPVTERLRELEDAETVMREVLRLADGKPHNLVRFWFPMDVAREAPRLMRKASIAEGSIPYLAGLGHKPVRYRWEIEPRPPSPDEARLLRIPDGVSVAHTWRTALRADESPVYVEEGVWPGHGARLVLEVE